MFEEIVAPTVKELFIDRIENLILTGELQIGEKLPSERELAEKMKISKTAVHSGISDLQRKGFLKVVPRIGIFVDDYTSNGTLEVLASIIHHNQGKMTSRNVRSILEVRAAIESIAIKDIIRLDDPKIDEDLKEIALQADKTDDPYKLAAIYYEFHHCICTSSGNIIIPLIMNAFREPAVRMWTNSTRALGAEESRNRINTLLRYIMERDEVQAVRYIEWICNTSEEIVNEHSL